MRIKGRLEFITKNILKEKAHVRGTLPSAPCRKGDPAPCEGERDSGRREGARRALGLRRGSRRVRKEPRRLAVAGPAAQQACLDHAGSLRQQRGPFRPQVPGRARLRPEGQPEAGPGRGAGEAPLSGVSLRRPGPAPPQHQKVRSGPGRPSPSAGRGGAAGTPPAPGTPPLRVHRLPPEPGRAPGHLPGRHPEGRYDRPGRPRPGLRRGGTAKASDSKRPFPPPGDRPPEADRGLAHSGGGLFDGERGAGRGKGKGGSFPRRGPAGGGAAAPLPGCPRLERLGRPDSGLSDAGLPARPAGRTAVPPPDGTTGQRRNPRVPGLRLPSGKRALPPARPFSGLSEGEALRKPQCRRDSCPREKGGRRALRGGGLLRRRRALHPMLRLQGTVRLLRGLSANCRLQLGGGPHRVLQGIRDRRTRGAAQGPLRGESSHNDPMRLRVLRGG